jgi:hypothetical protein
VLVFHDAVDIIVKIGIFLLLGFFQFLLLLHMLLVIDWILRNIAHIELLLLGLDLYLLLINLLVLLRSLRFIDLANDLQCIAEINLVKKDIVSIPSSHKILVILEA